MTATPSEPAANGLSARRAAVWLCVAWLVFVAWHPIFLGLQGDDQWFFDKTQMTGPFTSAMFDAFVTHREDRSRPVWDVLYYLCSSIAGPSTLVLKLISAVLLLATMAAYYRGARSILASARLRDRRLAVAAAVLWLVMPWTIVTKVSPSFVFSYVAALFFWPSACWFWRSVNQDRPAVLGPVLLQLLSYLTYEAFYFAYLVVLLFAAADLRRRRRSLRPLILPALIFTLVQAAAAIFNRLAGSLKESQTLSTVLGKWAYNLSLGALETLIASTYLWAPVVLAAAVVLLVRARHAMSTLDPADARPIAGALCWCGAGIVLGVGLYAIAGYSVSGRDGHATLTADFWLATVVAVGAGALAKSGAFRRPLTRWGAIAGAVALVASMESRASEWMRAATSWRTTWSWRSSAWRCTSRRWT